MSSRGNKAGGAGKRRSAAPPPAAPAAGASAAPAQPSGIVEGVKSVVARLSAGALGALAPQQQQQQQQRFSSHDDGAAAGAALAAVVEEERPAQEPQHALKQQHEALQHHEDGQQQQQVPWWRHAARWVQAFARPTAPAPDSEQPPRASLMPLLLALITLLLLTCAGSLLLAWRSGASAAAAAARARNEHLSLAADAARNASAALHAVCALEQRVAAWQAELPLNATAAAEREATRHSRQLEEQLRAALERQARQHQEQAQLAREQVEERLGVLGRAQARWEDELERVARDAALALQQLQQLSSSCVANGSEAAAAAPVHDVLPTTAPRRLPTELVAHSPAAPERLAPPAAARWWRVHSALHAALRGGGLWGATPQRRRGPVLPSARRAHAGLDDTAVCALPLRVRAAEGGGRPAAFLTLALRSPARAPALCVCLAAAPTPAGERSTWLARVSTAAQAGVGGDAAGSWHELGTLNLTAAAPDAAGDSGRTWADDAPRAPVCVGSGSGSEASAAGGRLVARVRVELQPLLEVAPPRGDVVVCAPEVEVLSECPAGERA